MVYIEIKYLQRDKYLHVVARISKRCSYFWLYSAWMGLRLLKKKELFLAEAWIVGLDGTEISVVTGSK